MMSRKEIEEYFNSIISKDEFKSEEEYQESLDIFIMAYQNSSKVMGNIHKGIQNSNIKTLKEILDSDEVLNLTVFIKDHTYFLDLAALKSTESPEIKMVVEASIQLKKELIEDLGEKASIKMANLLLDNNENDACLEVTEMLNNLKNRIPLLEDLRDRYAELENYDKAAIIRDRVIFLKKYLN